MKKFSKILFVVIIAVVIFFIGRNTANKTNNNTIIDDSQNMISNTVAQKDNNSLESYIKKAIIEIVNEKLYKDVTDKTEKVLAEGHKTLKTEEKYGKIYVYVVAEYGVYELENDEIMPVSASASPITIVLDSSDYRMIEYSLPSDNGDEAWMASLKEMFPEDLISEVTSVDYKEEFYQEQIKKYFEDENIIAKQDSENIKQILLDVMNSKHKFIDENNKNVYFKDFEIVEGQTAEVETYAFVDMDDDGIEELIIYTTSDYGAYVILHYENKEVYGYMIGIRSLENLKADGTFIESNGADSHEYSRMKFNKNEYSIETEAIYDRIDKIYKINDTDVSEKEIKDYTEKWSKKEDVSWSK